jgi:hypothetical protein
LTIRPRMIPPAIADKGKLRLGDGKRNGRL